MNAMQFKSEILKLIDEELAAVSVATQDPEDVAYAHGRQDALRSLRNAVYLTNTKGS